MVMIVMHGNLDHDTWPSFGKLCVCAFLNCAEVTDPVKYYPSIFQERPIPPRQETPGRGGSGWQEIILVVTLLLMTMTMVVIMVRRKITPRTGA